MSANSIVVTLDVFKNAPPPQRQCGRSKKSIGGEERLTSTHRDQHKRHNKSTISVVLFYWAILIQALGVPKDS